MEDTINVPVPEEVRKTMWDYLLARLRQADQDRARQFEISQKEILDSYANVFAKLPQRLGASGLGKDAESMRPILEAVREKGITTLSDDEAARLFAYGLRLREVLSSLGLDTPEAFVRVTLPAAKWYSCGLGAIAFDTYEVNVSEFQEIK